MELQDTVELMLSKNYTERFKAEYWQTKIRYNRLYEMLNKFDAGMLGFEPSCPVDMLRTQETSMREYLRLLEIRAIIEGINLQEKR